MTEENKDSTRPKLRLSRNAAETEPEKTSEPKPEAASEPIPEAASEPIPDLNSTRPEEETQEQKIGLGNLEAPVETPTNPRLRTPADETKDAASFNPENPSSETVEAPRAEEANHSTLKVPSEPAPVENESSDPKVEEAIDRIDEDHKKRGLLTSIIVISILLAVLGGSGYGLYYVLSSQGETEASASTGGEASQSETNEKESSGPIAKAKATIAKIPAIDSDLEKDISTKDAGNVTAEATPAEAIQAEATPAEATPAEATPAEATNEIVETAKVEANLNNDPKPATPPASAQNNPAIDFLTKAHIGGVRESDRPKVILNGESYIPGDLVDSGSGLRFIGFKDKKIAFRDAQGIVYIKSF